MLADRLYKRAATIAFRGIAVDSHEEFVRLGSQYGGWWVPVSTLAPGGIAYCAGAGEDVTFDLALLEHGLWVTTFDPTPRSVEYVTSLGIDDRHFRFLPVGWWSDDTQIDLFAPRNPAHVSYSALDLQGTGQSINVPVRRVSTLARELGDAKVDLIKMDIEGAEMSVIPDLIENGPLPRVLCVEFDKVRPFRDVTSLIRRLKSAGLVPAHSEERNVTFVHDLLGETGAL